MGDEAGTCRAPFDWLRRLGSPDDTILTVLASVPETNMLDDMDRGGLKFQACEDIFVNVMEPCGAFEVLCGNGGNR